MTQTQTNRRKRKQPDLCIEEALNKLEQDIGSVIIDPNDERSISLKEKLCNFILNFRVEIDMGTRNGTRSGSNTTNSHNRDQPLLSCSKYSFFITEMKPYSLFHPRLGPMYQRLEKLLLEYIDQVQVEQQPQTPYLRKRLEAWWEL